jgi:N-acetylmuramoyl-L-alanine amidase
MALRLLASLGCFLAILAACGPLWAGCDPAALAIAIDAGHGPKSPGATSASGVAEYRFNVRLAARVQQALVAAGFPKVFLLDPTGLDLPPAARAQRANAAGAGLLISIHHDSAQAQFFTSHSVNGQTRRFCDQFAGYSVFYSGRNRRPGDSLALARLLGRQMRREGLVFTRHHAADIPGERRPLVDEEVGVYRYDGLAVLHAAAMPAVLLEAGVIVNRTEETLLAGEERQMQTARAVARAVVNWCAGLRP